MNKMSNVAPDTMGRPDGLNEGDDNSQVVSSSDNKWSSQQNQYLRKLEKEKEMLVTEVQNARKESRHLSSCIVPQYKENNKILFAALALR